MTEQESPANIESLFYRVAGDLLNSCDDQEQLTFMGNIAMIAWNFSELSEDSAKACLESLRVHLPTIKQAEQARLLELIQSVQAQKKAVCPQTDMIITSIEFEVADDNVQAKFSAQAVDEYLRELEG